MTAVRGTACPVGSNSIRVAAVNIFDALWITSDGQPTQTEGRPTTYQDAIQALDSACSNGVRVVRFFASLWGPYMSWWVTNPELFWSQFDQLMGDIASRGLFVIPSIGYSDWHEVVNDAFPGTNESVNDFVLNETSVSRRVALQYFNDLVTRYASNPSILFWELGNELNLMVNLPAPHCDPAEQCFNTDQMVALTESLVAAVNNADPSSNRPISSGFSAPRPSAWHMEHCPVTGACPADPTGGTFWTVDTKEQWMEQLTSQQQSVDVWSIHYYNTSGTSCFFETCVNDMSVISAADDAAAAARAALYVGEFGGPSPEFTGPSEDAQLFPNLVLESQVESAQRNGSFLVSSIWAWSCPSHRTDMNCIWPGSNRTEEAGSDVMVSALKSTNTRLNS